MSCASRKVAPEEAAVPAGPGVLRGEPALFIALVALHVLPLWALAHFPTQDGPVHLENAVVLLRRAAVPVFTEYYEVVFRLVPNWFIQGLLAVLLYVATPRVAEALLATGYVIGLAIAFRLALPPGAKAAGFTLAVFPFLLGLTFHMGFANFSWSLVFYFLALAIWRTSRGRLRGTRALALGAAALLVALSHGITFIALFLTLIAAMLWELRAGRPRRQLLREAIPVALALFAPAALVAIFAATEGSASTLHWAPFVSRLVGLVTLSSIDAVDARDVWISGAFAAVILLAVGGALVDAIRGRDRIDEWLVATGALAVLVLVAPEEFGDGAFIGARLQTFPFLLAILYLGNRPAPGWTARAVPAAGAIASVALLAVHAPAYLQLSSAIEEFTSAAAQVRRNSVLLPLQFTAGRDLEGGRWVPYAYGPLYHAAGLIAASRDVVELTNYQANTRFFPIRFRAEKNPYLAISRGPGIEGRLDLPCVDLAAQKEIHIDYVLLWRPPGPLPESACVAHWYGQLLAGYEPAFLSQPRGFAELWKRR